MLQGRRPVEDECDGRWWGLIDQRIDEEALAVLLRVHVNMGAADWDLMGSIGHELRHTIEVVSNPSVTDTAALHYFYLHAGSTGGFLTPFETEVAIEAGAAQRAQGQKCPRTNLP